MSTIRLVEDKALDIARSLLHGVGGHITSELAETYILRLEAAAEAGEPWAVDRLRDFTIDAARHWLNAIRKQEARHTITSGGQSFDMPGYFAFPACDEDGEPTKGRQLRLWTEEPLDAVLAKAKALQTLATKEQAEAEIMQLSVRVAQRHGATTCAEGFRLAGILGEALDGDQLRQAANE